MRNTEDPAALWSWMRRVGHRPDYLARQALKDALRRYFHDEPWRLSGGATSQGLSLSHDFTERLDLALALAQLSARERTVIVLWLGAELSQEQVAERLRLSLETVKRAWLSAARTLLWIAEHDGAALDGDCGMEVAVQRGATRPVATDRRHGATTGLFRAR